MDDLSRRLEDIRGRVRAAALRARRDPSTVTLVAVTKGHPPEIVARLFDLGQMDVAENRAQELARKQEALGGRGHWHFIGHLQRNKVGQVAGKAILIHSVDSARLIAELERRAAALNIQQRILLEINIGGDPAKTGANPQDIPALLAALSDAPHLRAEGLMTIPPYSDEAESSRPHFAHLRELMRQIPSTPSFDPRHLSMG
ncbi:YggS family pyridoxal phosphate-dependent enzyme, partial [Candidatus Sumerlaeota bacterium]|nr:YggS family pyridoxal phosphate-dependent enzyme [Candidatus Sumerlaeota bacterium]